MNEEELKAKQKEYEDFISFCELLCFNLPLVEKEIAKKVIFFGDKAIVPVRGNHARIGTLLDLYYN